MKDEQNQDNTIKISVIVPIYNVSNYLEECLKSISSQTLKEIEVILINDGSTDNSKYICEEFLKKDKRFKLYNQENIGLGETRNKGIEIAKGEYLSFVDSDDYIDRDYLEILYHRAKKTKADIVEAETFQVDEYGKELMQEQSLKGRPDFTITQENIAIFFRDYYFASKYKHYACDKIYKRTFVLDNKLKFGDNRRIFAEDTWFQLQAIHHLPQITYMSGSFYRYRQRNTSIMHSEKMDLLKRQGTMCRNYYDLLHEDEESIESEYKACNLISLEALTMEALNQISIQGDFKNYLRKINNIKNNCFMRSQISGVFKNRSYRLEPRKGRKLFVAVIGLLYYMKLLTLAHFVLWIVYIIKERHRKG